MLAFYDFPAEHWKHLRTTNPIESTFATVRHRTVRSKGCLSNKTALAMVFKLAQAAQNSWRRLDGHNQSPKLIVGDQVAVPGERPPQGRKGAKTSRNRIETLEVQLEIGLRATGAVLSRALYGRKSEQQDKPCLHHIMVKRYGGLCLESGGNWFWRLSERVEFCGGQAARSRVSSAIS